MGMKDNFKQALQELYHAPLMNRQTSDASDAPDDSVAPVIPTKEVVLPELKPIRSENATTLIAAGTVIRGSVQTEGDLDLQGEIQGDVQSNGTLKLHGKLAGNATGKNIELNGIHIEGDITADNQISIDGTSQVIGNVQSNYLVLNGKIKGDVKVQQRLTLEGQAVITGNVSAAKLIVAEGAVLQGEVHMIPAKEPEQE